MRRSRWRCFWRWPFGHQWEHVVEGQHSFKRCRDCSKSKGHHFRPPHDSPHWTSPGGD